MALVDSIDKIVQSYFVAVTAEPFKYKKVEYRPRPLQVSPGIFRGYTCPAGCGGCCPRFSLDYLPSEETPYELEPRSIDFNGKHFEIFSDLQEDRKTEHFCRNLRMNDGRCGVHGFQPFSCDFELIRTAISQTTQNRMNTRLFGRGWQFLKVDGKRGAACQMLPVSSESLADTVRKLERLKQWCDYFCLKSVVGDIVDWARSGPHLEPLYLNQQFAKELSSGEKKVSLDIVGT